MVSNLVVSVNKFLGEYSFANVTMSFTSSLGNISGKKWVHIIFLEKADPGKTEPPKIFQLLLEKWNRFQFCSFHVFLLILLVELNHNILLFLYFLWYKAVVR